MTSYRKIERPSFAKTMQVVELAAKIWRIEAYRLIRRERTRAISFPRFAVVWALRRMGATLVSIAEALHFEDHSSVRHALARAEQMRDTDETFRARCDRLLAEATKPEIAAEPAQAA